MALFKTGHLKYLITLLLAFSFLSCGGAWVEKGKNGTQEFIGVGLSKDGLNRNDAMLNAQNNALIQISTQLEPEVVSLIEYYLRAGTDKSAELAPVLSDKELIETAELITRNFIYKIKPEGTYKTREDGVVKATVKISKDDFYKEMLREVPERIKRFDYGVIVKHDRADKKLNSKINRDIDEYEFDFTTQLIVLNMFGMFD